ncbi:Hpt domain-containing protein [Thermoanaerobacter wiegelii]|uniref:Hpt protein n=1 Tax=Thermoanaerobacter wiegelii Rt8.B1 TaxID=697303 RepID=G2MVQ7_9THEO|nr:Hpt domain-containing protein [Thermoanaerobacter wiegelii]AEM79557.1 Hpt protein [Thermoanaerobacter wiegelii Rt8.B1]
MMLDYIDAYVEETEEQLSRLEQLFLEIEKNSNQIEILNEIFRIIHTIKGSSATMGFSVVADFCHKLESLFDKLRKGELGVDDYLIDILFKSFDTLKDMISTSIKGENYDSHIVEELINVIDSFKQMDANNNDKKIEESNKETIEKKENQANDNIWKISVEISKDCVMKNARALIIEKYIEEMGNVICFEPSLDVLQREEVIGEKITAILESRMRDEDIVWKLRNVPDVINVEVKQDYGSKEVVRIKINTQNKIEDIMHLKEVMMRANMVELEFEEKPKLSYALLQLILAAYRENKEIHYKKTRGNVAKILNLMGIIS